MHKWGPPFDWDKLLTVTFRPFYSGGGGATVRHRLSDHRRDGALDSDGKTMPASNWEVFGVWQRTKKLAPLSVPVIYRIHTGRKKPATKPFPQSRPTRGEICTFFFHVPLQSDSSTIIPLPWIKPSLHQAKHGSRWSVLKANSELFPKPVYMQIHTAALCRPQSGKITWCHLFTLGGRARSFNHTKLFNNKKKEK